MGNFTYRGMSKPYLTVPRGLKLPAWSTVKREIKTVPGKPGGYVATTVIEVRQIEVPIRLKGKSFSNLQEIKEDLADWLVTDQVEELIFDDEPNRTYFAMVDGGLDLEEVVTTGRGKVVFICPDPYKYAPVNTLEISNPMVVTVEGNQPTPPYFRFNVWSGITGIDIVRDDAYMSIGQPETIGQTVYEEKTKMLDDEFNQNNFIGWGSSGIVPFQGAVHGKAAILDGMVYAESYGEGSAWHGPSMQQMFDPINDFMVRGHFMIRVTDTRHRGRTEVYLLAEDGSIMGRMGVELVSPNLRMNVYVELWKDNVRTRTLTFKGNAYHTEFFGYIDFIRKGNEFTIILSEQSNRDVNKWQVLRTETVKWTDVYEEYDKRLAGVAFFLGTYSNFVGAFRVRLRGIQVWRLNEQTGDIPLILAPNDIVEIDHKENTIIVNGSDRMDLKDFGADFFMLKPGDNLLMIEPSNHITGVIEWRDRFK